MHFSKVASLIKLARKAILFELENKNLNYNRSGEKQGVFVTLLKNEELRGCIGFPEPVLPLEEAVVQASRAAAFRDPRFLPITKKELDQITIELSILTKPKKIKNIEEIIIGQTGLIISKKDHSGLLLPQVAVEHNWTREEFLDHTCLKAGLKKYEWGDADIFVFKCQVFREKSPGGKVEKIL